MAFLRSLGFVLCIGLLVSTNAESATVSKAVTVRDTKQTTLSELDRFLELAKEAINDNAMRSFCWYIDGNVSTGASQDKTFSNIPYDFQPELVRIHADTAPVGSSLIIDINDDGSTIFSTNAEIDAGSTEQDGNEFFTQSEISAGSDVSLDIDQVGSGTAGADLTVCLYGR